MPACDPVLADHVRKRAAPGGKTTFGVLVSRTAKVFKPNAAAGRREAAA